METKVITNQPPSPEGRAPKEMAVYTLLAELGITYERLDHPAAATIRDCHDIDQRLGIRLCKNLFLCNTQKTIFYLLLMPGDKKFQTKELSAQINSARLSFAPEAQLEEFLNLTPGAVTVMGLMNDRQHRVTLLIDQDVLKEEYLGCHPNVNTASIKIKIHDLIEKFLPFTSHSYQAVELTGGRI